MPKTLAIIEDEYDDYQIVLEAFKELNEEMNNINLITSNNLDYDTSLNLIVEKKPDIILLDYQFNNSTNNGLDLLLYLKKNEPLYFPYIILTSSQITKAYGNIFYSELKKKYYINEINKSNFGYITKRANELIALNDALILASKRSGYPNLVMFGKTEYKAFDLIAIHKDGILKDTTNLKFIFYTSK